MKIFFRLRIISDYKMLCNVGAKYVFYHAGKLYLGDERLLDYKRLVKLPSKIPEIFVSARLIERLLRLEPRLAYPINDKEFLLSYQGAIFRVDLNGSVVKEHEYISTMNNPLSFCTDNGRVLYGEYFGNLNHEEVSIYERRDDSCWVRIYNFPKGTVQHIHQICYDEYRNCYWVLTGDQDSECAIWQADIDFNRVVPIFSGKQKYRSCFIMPTAKGIAYSTDTPLESNWVFYSEQDKDGKWLEPRKIFEMPGPCIYGTKMDNGRFVMATSVEPDASLPPKRYYFTSKLGKGVKDRYTHIICGNPEESFEEVLRIKKDWLKMWLFQFGNILFPTIGDKSRLICTGQSLKGIDGKTIEIIIEKNK